MFRGSRRGDCHGRSAFLGGGGRGPWWDGVWPGSPFDRLMMRGLDDDHGAAAAGAGPGEFRQVGEMLTRVLDGLAANPNDKGAIEAEVRNEAGEMCGRSPVYVESWELG